MPWLAAAFVAAATQVAFAQGDLKVPRTIEAGAAFSIETTGSGKGVLYITGPGDALKRELQLGQTASFAAGDLHNAGRYLATLTGGPATSTGWIDVVPAKQPATLSFLAKPSRLPVGLHNGISGAVYVFDTYQNLILTPMPISFELTGVSAAAQARTVVTRNGDAWTVMDSSPKEGAAQFVAKAAGITSTRVIEQVPGDPCGLSMSARQSGQKIELATAPIRDCTGNAVPEGTVVTFTEVYNGAQTTVDVPVKRGIAQAEVPAYNGAKLSVAAGVVLGNEIRWSKQ